MLLCLWLNNALPATIPPSTALSLLSFLLTTVHGQSSRNRAVSVEAREGFVGILPESTHTMVAIFYARNKT